MPRKPQKTDSDQAKMNKSSEKNASHKSIQTYWDALSHNERVRVICGLVLWTVTFLVSVSVISFFLTGKEDASLVELIHTERLSQMPSFHNWLGLPGAVVSRAIIDGCFGLFSILFLVMGTVYGLKIINPKVNVHGLKLFFCSAFLMLWGAIACGFVQLFVGEELYFRLGGAFGNWVATLGTNYMHAFCMGVLIVMTLVIFLIIADKHFVEKVQYMWQRMICSLHRRKQDESVAVQGEPDDNQGAITIKLDVTGNRDTPEANTDENKTAEGVTIEIVGNDQPETPETKNNEVTPEPEVEPQNPVLDITTPTKETIQGEAIHEPVEDMGPYDPRKDLENYQFPPLSLLKVYDNETAPVIDPEEQQANANRIVQTLRNYDVEIESIKATVGPTVTLYEVVPKAGTRISKIQSLENDIMLSLSAIGIRIIAPMPGKGTVGIEVPNEKPQVVSMHSVIASKRFQEESKMKLPVAIGRTITNEVFTFDLAKTPHLLVAGATGQGKSVGLNAIIASLIYKKHPAELKFVLVDPKMVEFSIYKPLIRHYMAAMPDQEDRDIIITDCQKVINTLNSLVIEMEDRYSLLADANCRNLEDYNDKFNSRHLNPTKDVENVVTHKILHHKFMPYLVIVIDEYGDFIMQAGKEVERPIQRIAQKARAVGMHMILATQRPDVKIVTGTIKANIPTRIAFRTQSVVDSRTVLDAKGADQLIGKGDMLYSGGGNLTRIQCAFIDTPEVEALVEHVSQQQHFLEPYQLPEYVPEGQEDTVQPGSVDTKRLDPMFADVARYVVSKQEGSTSRLQRAFEIGYNRAGKLSDQLEAVGIVGPNKGPKGRDVLIQDLESLEQLLQQYGCN
ncbi:MAG: DNA translocase FtsK [Paludibacteraceae bacterium]|nr:DNA translocase FtsK [Paludibacteraceae bacterium]